MIPVTLIGGYLGAGKTTLINNALRHADGRRLAVLVNDFGDLAIDEDLIEARDEDGGRSREVWPKGDVGRSREWVPEPLLGTISPVPADGSVRIGDWLLTLPTGEQIAQVFVLEKEPRVIVLTKNFALGEWDLSVLSRELETRDL